MTLDLFRVSMQAQSNYTALMMVQQQQHVPHSASISNSSSLIDYSLPGNRLVQHADGTVEILSRSLGEVVGEAAIRGFSYCKKKFTLLTGLPVFIQQGANSVMKAIISFDRFLTQAVTLPAVGAQELVPFRHYTSSEIVGIDTGSYQPFVTALPQKNRHELLRDKVLQKNYNEFIEEINKLAFFIIKSSQIYDEFMQDSIIKECLLFEDIELYFRNENRTLSRFDLPPKDCAVNKLRMQLPKTSFEQRRVTVVRRFSFTNNHKNISLTGTPHNQENSKCLENPVIMVLLQALAPYAALLTAHNVGGNIYTYEGFTELFKDDDIVRNTKDQIKAYKKYVEDSMEVIKDLSITEITSRTIQSRERIKRLVQSIFEKQQLTLSLQKAWDGWYHFEELRTDKGLCSSWSVVQYGRVWNGEMFSFELIE